MLNLTDICTFFNFFFASSSEIVTPESFSTLTSKTKVAFGFENTKTKQFIPNYSTGFLPINQLLNVYEILLKAYPDSCPGLHVTLCEVDGLNRGTESKPSYRSKENITFSRVLCVDIDRGITNFEYKKLVIDYKPQMVVCSSPGRYHFFWKIKPGEIHTKAPKARTMPDGSDVAVTSLSPWSMLQLGLALELQGDLQRHDITATIRVPGFPRILKDGNLFAPSVELFPEFPCKAYSHLEILTQFPFLPERSVEAYKKFKEQQKERAKIASELVKTTLQPSIDLSTTMPDVDIGQRNASVYSISSEFAFTHNLSETEAIEKVLLINHSFSNPLPEQECLSAAKSGWRHGSAAREKKKDEVIAVLGKAELNGSKPHATQSHTHTESEDDKLSENLNEVATLFSKRLWKHRTTTIELLRIGVLDRLLQKFTEKMCDCFAEIGLFTAQGLKASIRITTAWGKPVTQFQLISEKQLIQIARKALAMFSDQITLNTDDSLLPLIGNLGDLTNHQRDDIAKQFVQQTTIYPLTAIQPSHLVVFQNGIFDTRTGTFTSDAKAPMRFTHPIPCTYVTDTTKIPAVFQAYMDQWFPGDVNIYKFMLRWMAYCATTDNSKNLFSFFHGPSRAGKGSLSRLICALVGEANFAPLDYQALNQPFLFASAVDKLVLVFDEVQGTTQEHQARLANLKKILGGEKIQINPKFQTPYAAHIIGKVIMQSNENLMYEDKGHSLKSRMLAIGFEHSFVGSSVQNPTMEILNAEADILMSSAVREYSEAVRTLAWDHCFHFEKSRALQVGKEEVVEKLSLDAYICAHFLKVEEGKSIKNTVLAELLIFCSDGKLTELNTVRKGRLFAEIATTFPTVKQSKHLLFGTDKKEHVGHTNLTLDVKALHEKYPELVDDCANLQLLYPNLFEALVDKT